MKTIRTVLICALFFLLLCNKSSAQNIFPAAGAAGIGTTAPNASALLEIKSTAKGFLAPRMTLVQRNAIPSPATGLLIYQTNGTPGFYYYNGTSWSAVTAKNFWSLTGNAGSDSSKNFLGTTDAHPLVFRVNNKKAGYIDYNIAAANTAFGYQALNGNTTGAYNTANGYDALSINTTGSNNTAGGYNTLGSNTTGYNNTALGSFNLSYNTTGIDNTSIGNGALQANSTGNDNTATGYFTLYTNTTGSQNTAYGEAALNHTTTGSYNTSTGSASLYLNTTGYSNVAVGISALYSNTDRGNLVAVGDSALYFNGTGAVNVHEATENTAIGSKSLFSNTIGSRNTANGFKALYSNTTGYDNIASGDAALFNNTTGISNTAYGGYSLYYNTTGNLNTANGGAALYFNTNGNYNTASGNGALYFNTTGNYNTADGLDALVNNTTGNTNTAVGSNALSLNTTGNENTAIGAYADFNSGGYTNSSAIGSKSLITAGNQVRIGDNKVTSIGGYANWTNISDGRVKKNIKANVPGLNFINKLNPVTYNLDLDAADKIIQRPAIKDKEGKTVQPSSQDVTERKVKVAVLYTGFVAQDVEKAAKSLNYDFSGVDASKNDKDLYGLRYSEFVVPLVKAVQELSAKNDDLQNQIDELKAMIVSNQSSVNNKQPALISSISIEQNIPNPFTHTTNVSYTLPEKFTHARIVITDKNGKTIKSINVSGSGRSSLNVDAATLASGAYNYSLIVDGRLIGTKQMILAR